MLAGLALPAFAPSAAWAADPIAYVANNGSNTVLTIDTASNTVVGSPIPVGSQPFDVAVAPDRRHAYVADFGSNDVSVIDTATDTVVATVPVGGNPERLAITPDGLHAYVANNGTNDVSVIDTTSNAVVTTITDNFGPFGVAITPDGLHAYVTNYATSTVAVIDTTTNGIVATIVLANTAGPVGVSVALPPVPQPSLTITKSHTGNFTPGRIGVYTIAVGNNGNAATDGTTVTVQDTLPAGLTALSITGTGWRCTLSTLTCTRTSVLNPGGTYPAITLRVRVARNIPPQVVTNSVTVSGGGDGTATATATDPTIIDPAGPGPWHYCYCHSSGWSHSDEVS